MATALLISLPLVFVIGMAIQRGNTCTVVAFDDDIVHHGSWDRFLSIVYTWFWVAGGLALLALATGFRPSAHVFPVTVWSMIGGLVLGIGAVVNGACTTGTIARIGSGEFAYLLTIAGFFVGCLLAPRIFGKGPTTHVASVPDTTSVSHPVVPLIGLAVVAVLTARRLIAGPHESFGDFLRSAWDPRTAVLIIAVLFVTMVQIYAAWAYTELLGDIAHGDTHESIHQLILLGGLLAGAIVAGRTMRGARLIGPLAPRIIRCFCGGLIMGAGFSVAPGAFDALTLYGQPLLLPFAWVVMASSYVSILIGVMYLRSKLGSWIKARRG